ncbi:recombinase RarA, partial [Candidatus Beckwithbacteria bacterium CG10_big_fil_rev_8_21_14_0_10_34_10]
LNLRNPVTKYMKSWEYGKGYEQYPDKNVSLLPDKLKGRKYYFPKKK